MTDADEDATVDADTATGIAGKADSSAKANGRRDKKGNKGDKRPNVFARIALFFRQVVAELKKVIWPTRRDLISYTWVVLIFCIAMSLFVALCDFLFGQGVLKVFGGGG